MDEMKLKFRDAVAAKLAAAAESDAKTELVEELSDNLHRRYEDLIDSGVEKDAAFGRAMDDLGDVDELLEYLKGLSPDGPRPEPGPGPDWDCWPGKDELNELVDNVGGIVRSALDQASEAMRQAREAMRQAERERDRWRRVNPEQDPRPEERGEVHIGEDGSVHIEEPGEPKKGGWGFTAELDTDAGKFFAGAGPREEPDVVYGFGYDKDKGGFFTQWGESAEGGGQKAGGPCFAGVNTWFERVQDDTYAVKTDCPLRGIDVQTGNGDVTVRLLNGEDDPVRLGGDVDQLEVKVTGDGVLAIRPGRTASSNFFFSRGMSGADVELYLPRRRWEFLQVSASSGDVELEDGIELDRLSVRTANGDLRAATRSCGKVYFESASGDVELEGLNGSALVKTASGDVRLSGRMDQIQASSASGDIELEGSVKAVRLSSMSGDLRVETRELPEAAELSSKSGSCELRIPGDGPFTAKFRTTSGEVSSDFFDFQGSGRSLSFDFQGGGRAYYLSSISGDLELLRY